LNDDVRALIRRDPTTAFWSALFVALLLSSAFFSFPGPLGIAFLGIVVGSVISFISIGIVLIYRTNRIINFAQADIGAVAVVVTVMLVSQTKMNYYVGAAIGIVLALLLGALIETAVIRRFFKAPRLILTIATIGLTQLLVFIEVVIPRIFRIDFITAFVTPFQMRFVIPDPTGKSIGIPFDANFVVAIASVPIVIAALSLFLKFTSVGVASRAVADNLERASLLGIPVKRVSTVIWIVAAGLSAIGALIRAPTVGLSVVGAALPGTLLVRALAPAVVAKMENLRTTFIASLVLSILDQAAYFATHDQSISNAILFLVIIAALIVRRRGVVSRAQEIEGASWQAAKEVRPIPTELVRVPEVSGGFKLLGVVGLALLIGFARVGSTPTVWLFALILIFSIVGLSLVVLTGWAGQISLGQFAFVAVGAAVCAKLVVDKGWNLLLALLVAGLVGAVIAVLIGLPALRIRGLLLAVSTLAFGLFVVSVVLTVRYFPWLTVPGRFDRPSLFGLDLNSQRTFFGVVLVITLGVLMSVRSLRRSRLGRVLIAARDNERAVRAFGVNVTAARISAFAISGFFAALAGGLYAMHQNTIAPSAFGVEASLQVFVMVVIGGLGSIPGAFIGATYLFVARFLLPGPLSLLATGLGLVILLMILPGGLGQLVYGWRDSFLRLVARRRKIIVPSLVADTMVDTSILLPGAPKEEAVTAEAVS
jgi:branched-chain amino acid transport system permease protein